MRRLPVPCAQLLLPMALALYASTPAHAGDNDLVLARLGAQRTDGAGNRIGVTPSNLAFRALASELGVVLAPRLLAPADTLGFGGFQFSADYGFTSISNDQPFWRARSSSAHADATAAGDGILHGNGVMPTVGIFMRKGVWAPLPSFEVGLGAVHLVDSQMWAAQGYAKFALHEGYHDLPIPSAAIRGGVSRIMGSEQIDLTVASFDASLSKDFGIMNTMTLSPYGGWNLLFIIPRSEVIDKTPDVDPQVVRADLVNNFAFRDQSNILRHRFFGGLKLQYYVFALTLEASLTTAGSSADEQTGTDTPCEDPPTTTQCDADDQAGTQETYILSFGLDF